MALCLCPAEPSKSWQNQASRTTAPLLLVGLVDVNSFLVKDYQRILAPNFERLTMRRGYWGVEGVMVYESNE